jgi:molybdopterin-guanine dinucleotide biosynthesis protein
MQIVIIGGPHSGVGKTLACERALQALAGRRIGAIKLTVADGEFDRSHDHGAAALSVADAAGICGRGASCGVCETVSGRVPSRTIVTDGAILKPGTDTWRLSRAGAVAVAWVIALRDAAPEAIDGAMRHLRDRGADDVVIEGTTALDWIRPAASVMVVTDPGRKWKEVARRRVGGCDIVLRNHVPENVGELRPPPEFDSAKPLDCDLSREDDPGTQRFASTLRDLVALASIAR